MTREKDCRRARKLAIAGTTARRRGVGWAWRRFRCQGRRLREAAENLEDGLT